MNRINLLRCACGCGSKIGKYAKYVLGHHLKGKRGNTAGRKMGLEERKRRSNKVPWNKGKTGIYKHRQEARDKISLAASNRIQPEKTKNKIRDSIIQHNKNKGSEFVFINGEYTEEIICLKMWCADNELDYQKVFSYLDKGPVKMIPRYDSPTRRWFLGKEIRRK